MFCSNCGKENIKEAVACTGCGVALNSIKTVNRKQVDPNDASSKGFAFLGFLMPLVGIILWLIWRNETPLRAKSAGKGAIIGIVVSVVLSIIAIIVMVILVAMYGQDLFSGFIPNIMY